MLTQNPSKLEKLVEFAKKGICIVKLLIFCNFFFIDSKVIKVIKKFFYLIGGIGTCIANQDIIAKSEVDLMFYTGRL